MEQLDLEDYIKEKKAQKEKKSDWESIRVGDLVKYWTEPARAPRVGLVVQEFPANVYDSRAYQVLTTDGHKITIKVNWLSKIT